MSILYKINVRWRFRRGEITTLSSSFTIITLNKKNVIYIINNNEQMCMPWHRYNMRSRQIERSEVSYCFACPMRIYVYSIHNVYIQRKRNL